MLLLTHMNVIHQPLSGEQKEWHKSRSLIEALANAARGLYLSFERERNIKTQVIIYIIVIAAALWFQLSLTDIALLVLTFSVVLSLEIINTALENYLNIVEPHYQESVRSLKDIFAAAVLIAGLAAFTISLLLLGPPLFRLYRLFVSFV